MPVGDGPVAVIALTSRGFLPDQFLLLWPRHRPTASVGGSEIGVRIALGATCARVVGLVLREATLLLGIGLAIGVAFAVWAGRAAASLVYGMKPGDPLALGDCLIFIFQNISRLALESLADCVQRR